MIKGKVKFFDNKKGFGFITSEDGEDYFVHFSEIQTDEDFKKLDEGNQVEFETVDSGRGPTAINVNKIS